MGQGRGQAGLWHVAVVLTEEACRVTEDPKHHAVVDGDAGKGEGHALKEAKYLWESPEGGSVRAQEGYWWASMFPELPATQTLLTSC